MQQENLMIYPALGIVEDFGMPSCQPSKLGGFHF
jgi:hypothetical protein